MFIGQGGWNYEQSLQTVFHFIFYNVHKFWCFTANCRAQLANVLGRPPNWHNRPDIGSKSDYAFLISPSLTQEGFSEGTLWRDEKSNDDEFYHFFNSGERWSKELKGPHAWGRLIYSPIFEIFPKFVCFEIFTRLNFKSSTEITQHWKLQNLHISKYTNGKFKPKLNTYSWPKFKLLK